MSREGITIPVIQNILKETSGRDKITKLIQYVAKLASYNLKESDKDRSLRFAKLSNAIGMFPLILYFS